MEVEEQREGGGEAEQQTRSCSSCRMRISSLLHRGPPFGGSMSLLCENTFVTLWRCTSDADARGASVGSLEATASDDQGRREERKGRWTGAQDRCNEAVIAYVRLHSHIISSDDVQSEDDLLDWRVL